MVGDLFFDPTDLALEAAMQCFQMKHVNASVRVGFGTSSLFALDLRVAIAFS